MIELRLGAEAIPLPPGDRRHGAVAGRAGELAAGARGGAPRGAGDRRGRARVPVPRRHRGGDHRLERQEHDRDAHRGDARRVGTSTPCSAATSASRWRRRSTVRPGASFVVELSSFQLETVRTFQRRRRGAAQRHARSPGSLPRLRGVRRGQGAHLRAPGRAVGRGARTRTIRRRWRSAPASSARAGVGSRCAARSRMAATSTAAPWSRPRPGARRELFTVGRGGDGGQPQRRERDGGVAARARRRWRSRQPAPRRLAVRRTAAPHPAHPRAPRRRLVRRLQGHQRRRHAEVARRVPGPLACT